jgi:outer membrane receptor protein involved in Fe transport
MMTRRMTRPMWHFAMSLALGCCSTLTVLRPSVAEDAKPEEATERQRAGLTQGTLSAYTLPPINVYGVAEQPPTIPVTTRFGTQYNVVTEEQIRQQASLDFYDALRNVPGVMYQKKNIIGGQTGPSLYIRGRGASHPSPDINILFDDVPRSGVLYGQALADGIPVYALGGMEIYKYPQPSRFGNGYGMINFIPKYMTQPGREFNVGAEGGSYGTVAENVSAGAKEGPVDIYAAQSWLSTNGHVAHSAGHQQSDYVNTGAQVAENWSVRFMANYVDATTQAPDNPLTGSPKYPRNYDTKTTLGNLTLANEYEQASGYVKAYYNKTNFWLVGESNGTATSRQSNDLYGLRGRETFRPWSGSEIVAGFDLDRMELENRQVSLTTFTEKVWDFPNVTLLSPYLALSQKFGADVGFHVTPSAGVRYYDNSVFEDKVAPQAGLVVGYANTDLNFNYAKGVNYPSPVVLQNFLENKSLPSGFDTKKIKPEVVDHYEVGLTHTWHGNASLSGTVFYDDGRDRIRAYMYGAAADETFFNSTTAKYKIRGMELSGRLTPMKDLDVFAGATWLRVKATGDDGIEADKMPYAPDFALQTGFKWRFLKDFQLGGDYQYLRNVYAATSARTADPAHPTSNFAVLTDANKLPDINVVNMRLDYLFDYEPLHIKQGKVYVAVNNLFNRKYAYALETDGTKTGYYYMPGTTFMIGSSFKFM